MKPHLESAKKSPLLPFRILFALTLISAGTIVPAFAADAGQSGSVTGRVYNPTTHEYVYRAEVATAGSSVFTESDGTYTIGNLPAGQVEVTVSYSGYNDMKATVAIEPGKTVVQDFNISPEEIIKLGEYNVSADAEGNAKAVMEQRAALNKTTILDADSFGENPDGNVGEFLKLISGVTMQYAFIEARGMSLDGLGPKYASLTEDNNSIANGASASFSSTNRGVELDAISFTGIASVEVNKTLTADMSATATAGNINLRSKNAFERDGRLITLDTSIEGDAWDLSFKKTYGPTGDTTSVKNRPNFMLGYADTFFKKRLGIVLTLSEAQHWIPRDDQSQNYSYANLATAGPQITRLVFATNQAFVTSNVMNFNADFKASDNLVLSWRSSYSARNLPAWKTQWNLNVSAKDILAGSTISSMTTKVDGTTTNLSEGAQVANDKYENTGAVSPRFKYTQGEFELDGGVNYSRASAEYTDMSNGFFTIATSQLSNMSWAAKRSGPEATDWAITETSGRPWNQASNFDLDSAPANNIGSRADKGVQTILSGFLDATIPVKLPFPMTIKAGAVDQATTFSLNGVGAENWSYIGPGGSQTSPLSTLPAEQHTEFPSGAPMSGQFWALGMPSPDRTALYQEYQKFPQYFALDTVNDFQAELLFPKSLREKVEAGYAMANATFGRLRLNLGLRYEETETTSHLLPQISPAVIAATRPDLKAGTIPYILYEYNNGVTTTTKNSYGNAFLSGGAKYKLTKALDLQLSFSNSTQRPDYSNLAGTFSVNDTTQIVTVPNPNLKPELGTKYYAGFNYYIEPAGVLSIGTYYMELQHLQVPGQQVTQAAAGMTNYTEYNNYQFITTENVPGTTQYRGLEVDYRQQLTFLPGILKGLGVFGNLNRLIASSEVIGALNKSAAGGLFFTYKKFDARANVTWQAPYLTSQTAATASVAEINSYTAERTALDIEVGYKILANTRLYLSGRDVTDSPFKTYQVNGAYGHMIVDSVATYGAYWTLGFKTQF